MTSPERTDPTIDELEELRLALESSMTGISLLDTSGQFIMVRKGYAQMMGYAEGELVGESWLCVVPPEAHDLAIAAIKRCLDQGRAEVDLPALRKDGSTFTKQINLVKKVDDQGRHIGHYCFMRDVTERRHLEAKLRHSEKMRAVGQLTAGVAHNINNVLQVITAGLELAQDSKPGERQEYLADAAEAAQQGTDVVRQLMLFTRRPEQAKPEPIELHPLIARVARICRETFDRAVTIVTSVDHDLPRVIGEPAQLESVFLNLALNAHDALLSTDLRDRWIRISARAALPAKGSHRVIVTVEDNGPGIDPRVRDRIFEPFFTTKDIGRATGLGLSTARAVVEQYGGSLDLVGRRDGACFALELLASEPIATDITTETAPTPASIEGRAFLLVEDQPLVRTTTARALERRGARVLTADDGDEALEVFEQHRNEIDAVILDISLPRRSGREVLRILRQRSPHIPICVLSGLALQHGELDEASVVLSKPLAPSELVRALTQLTT